MSHFTVLVVGDDPEGQLAPFQENNMADCPKEYLKFNEVETEELINYKTKGTEKVFYNGKQYNLFDSELKNIIAQTLNLSNDLKSSFLRSRDATDKINTAIAALGPKEIKFTDIYPTFEEYMADWVGHKDRDPETGKYGYWENPNAKWDWYVIGGRWCGFFKLKKSAEKTDKLIGKPGVFGNLPDKDCDQAMKGEIDFDWMYNSNKLRAEKDWQQYQDALTSGKFEISPGKTIQFNKESDGYWHFGVEKGDTKETYVIRHSMMNTFAVVKDGYWYEKGSMGWWGMVSGEKDAETWDEQWKKLVMGLPDNTLLTLVDCHI